MAEPTGMMMDAVDSSGNTVTIYSKTGQPYTEAQFNTAMQQYNSGKGEGDNFLVLKPGVANSLRRTFETAQEYIQPGLEQFGKGLIGGLATPVNALLTLGEKAGIIPEGTGTAGKQVAEDIGSATGRFAGSSIKTPAGAGMTAALTAAAPIMAPIAGATGGMRALPLLSNMGKAGLAGTAGSTLASAATGDSPTWGKTAAEFATAAGAGGLSSVIQYGITRFISPDRAEQVAKGVMDELKGGFPALANDPNMINIAGSSPRQIERAVQRLSEGLRGTVDDVVGDFIPAMNNTLPRRLSVGQQATMRAQLRRVVGAQNDIIDGTIKGDAKVIAEATAKLNGVLDVKTGQYVGGLMNDIRDSIRTMYPKMKTEGAELRVEMLINGLNGRLDVTRQGAQVFKYMRDAGTHEQWNPMEFAQRIRGEYQQPGNPLLERIGNILGGGRPLTAMPPPGQPEPGGEFARRAYNIGKEFIPFIGNKVPSMPYKGAQVPWPAPSTSPAIPTIAGQQVGQSTIRQSRESISEEAIRDFLKKRARE